jgi:HD superfamily phosphohydrolase
VKGVLINDCKWVYFHDIVVLSQALKRRAIKFAMDNTTSKGHLFSVEVLIEDTTNGAALEKLLHLLNSNVVKDYQIKSGIQLGKLIELNLNSASDPKAIDLTDTANPPPAKIPKQQGNLVVDQLAKFKQDNTLIRLTVVKGKGVKLSLPCRILNYDADTQNVSVYHVDEKRVYLFKLNEIDDFNIG